MRNISYAFLLSSLFYGITPSLAIQASDVLSDGANSKIFKGVEVRKGTIAATIKNAERLDLLLSSEGNEEEIVKLIEDQRPLAKALWAVDLTQVIPLDKWISDPKRPGRIVIAAMVLQQVPELANDKSRKRLLQVLNINQKLHPVLKREIEAALKGVQ